MNIMIDGWTVFGRDRGQVVERAYRYDPGADRIICRVTDHADGRVTYYAAAGPFADDFGWTGSEGAAPFDDMTWGGAL